MSLGDYFRFDPLGAAVNVLLGASPVPLPGVPETQASRFGAVLAAGAPLGAGMKSLKALATGEEAAGQAAKGIKAYHGSPHEFEKFAMEKIGTGEGAQAYGHGLYFAEREGVAKAYRDALSGQTYHPEWMKLHQRELDLMGEIDRINDTIGRESLARGAKGAPGWGQLGAEHPDVVKKWAPDLARVNTELSTVRREMSKIPQTIDVPGRMYEVNIKADPEHFLDWDKPLSEQSEHVRQALEAAGVKAENPMLAQLRATHGSEYPTGADVYSAAKRAAGEHSVMGSGERATELLRQAGIKGIQYLDRASRAAGEGTRNYVLFDDALIDILRKYGFLPPVVGGTLGLSQLARPSQQGQQ
jgi:hypothetical protein